MKRLLPAYPLFLKDPFFSMHLAGEKLNGAPITFWSGQQKTLLGYIKIDGVAYRFLGQGTDKELKQTKIEISTFKTQFYFEHEEDTFTVEFVSPLPLDDLDLLSMPFCYLNYEYKSKENRNIEVSLILSEDWLYNEKNKDSLLGIKGTVLNLGDFELASFRSRRQNYLSHTDDEKLADHGTWFLSGEKAYYLDKNALNSYLDSNFEHTYLGENKFLLATNKKRKGMLGIGRDEVVSLQYFDEILAPYYKHSGLNAFSAFSYLYKNYKKIEAHLSTFDKQLKKDAMNISEKYYFLVSASYRQSIAAHKLGQKQDGELVFISKECSSNGCAATVDVSYPAIPLYLLYNPELVSAMLRPIFAFAKMPVWEYDFAPHDAGRFPLIIGQVYGLNRIDDFYHYGGDDRGVFETDNLYYTYPKGHDVYNYHYQMPVESSANMIIMAYSTFVYLKDIKLLKENYDILTKWANYLAENGYMPENQLCTDDFAGHLEKNINLTVKATAALKAYVEIARALNDSKTVDTYTKILNKFVTLLEDVSNEHGFLPLTFSDGDERFSLKYNLAIDRLFDFNLFSDELYERELVKYRQNIEEFGIRLDPRNTYAKVDWQFWIASFADDELKETIFAKTIHYLEQLENRWPFPDWNDSTKPICYEFRNRTVLGGNFMPLLMYKAKNN